MDVARPHPRAGASEVRGNRHSSRPPTLRSSHVAEAQAQGPGLLRGGEPASSRSRGDSWNAPSGREGAEDFKGKNKMLCCHVQASEGRRLWLRAARGHSDRHICHRPAPVHVHVGQAAHRRGRGVLLSRKEEAPRGKATEKASAAAAVAAAAARVR